MAGREGKVQCHKKSREKQEGVFANNRHGGGGGKSPSLATGFKVKKKAEGKTVT